MRERIVWEIHFILFRRTEPLGQDIGVGQGAVCHGGDEEHGYIVEASVLQILCEALKQVIDHSRGIAGNQGGSIVPNR